MWGNVLNEETGQREGAKSIDAEEVYRLYYVKNLTKEQVAKELSTTEWALRNVFKERGWESRIRSFETEEERVQARKDTVEKRLQRIKDLRAEKFGTRCRICEETKHLSIHKKDGEEHNKEFLWRKMNLENVNPEEWAALCISCHRGTHWMMNRYGKDWDSIEALATKPAKPRNLEPLELPSKDTPSSPEYLAIKDNSEGDTEALRRALFGETCYFCNTHYENKKVPIHRKDGRPHQEKLTKKEVFFRTLDPKEWVALCNEHHRQVHWAIESLNLDWEDLEDDS